MVAGLIFTGACGSQGDFDATGSDNAEPQSGGVTITNTVGSPAEMNVGDIFVVSFDKGETAKMDFAGVAPEAEFTFAITELDSESGSYVAQMMDEAMIPPEGKALASLSEETEEWGDFSVSAAFDQQLRNIEQVMASEEDVDQQEIAFKAATVDMDVAVGSQERFRVLNSLSNMSSYSTVTAELRCLSANVKFYVDVTTSAGDLSDADVDSLCQNFDKAVGLERDIFGDESDVNSDGHVTVLLTPEINKLGYMGGGVITGFFYAGDLKARSSSNQLSNEQEIIYALVPDPSGKYGVTIPKAFAMGNLLPAVLPHEFQHAINYNQHVLVGKGAAEENWLNEALSHLAEDLTGVGFENPSRAKIFLQSTQKYPLISEGGSPNLGERGGSYLFIRYMYEQAKDGRAFLRSLVESGNTGVANIEDAFGGTEPAFDQFGEFLLRWSVALAVTNQGITQDARYTYKDRVWDSETNYWTGTCIVCDPEDGRGTMMTGVKLNAYYGVEQVSLEAGASKFFSLADEEPDVITLKSTASGSFGATLIRTK